MRYVFNNLISCILLLGITHLVSTYRKSRERVSVLGIENTLSSREPTDSTVEQERRPSMEVYSQMSDMTTTTECLPPSNFKVQTGNLAEIDTFYTNDIGNDLKQKSQRHECITNNCCSSLSPKTKNNKKMWTLEEDKLLIEKLLQITNLNVDQISSKVVRDQSIILAQVLGRVSSSIVGRWTSYLQPIILSDIHGKLNYNVVPEVYSFLIQQKIKKIDHIDWSHMVNRWPYQTEQSLKLIVRNASSSGKATKAKHLYQKLKHLLPLKRKPIPSKDKGFNTTIADFYNNLIKSKRVLKPQSVNLPESSSTLQSASTLLIQNPDGNSSKVCQSNKDFLSSQICTSTPVKKSNWSLDEEKMLIKSIFEIKPHLNASHVDERTAKEIFPLVQNRINRPVPSMLSHWFLVLQPIILSYMYGKLEQPITAAIFSHLITRKVKSIQNIDWKILLHIWPFQNERSLKAIISRANDDPRVPSNKVELYEKLHVLLPYYANKKITPKKMRSNKNIIDFYEAIMKKKRQEEYKTLYR